ncbi:DUF4236 domain-containing protein [Streptomyces sp. NPDC060194]|uniref:DUF4236 domain-containing protein n=1 Tax=Streptomyces sp. NPDC060194 TaxID=3347069 RepID=UPI00365B7876
MAFYYHKRIPVIPKLLHLNVTNHGWSWTFGGRRANITRGRGHSSVRLPGGFSLRRDRHHR